MTNFIQEYLVGLGFDPDETSFKKFVDLVARADREVSSHFGGMAKTILEAQGAILGAFGSISAAIIGVVDKAAMADQGYRLLGLRMMMTTEQARKMDIVTKALGASLGEIIYDKELHARAEYLSRDVDRMSAALGKNFERNMIGIRTFRMELSRLEMGVKFLGMSFASDLFTKLGGEGFLKRIDQWVTDLQDKIPLIADELSNYAIPVLKDTWTIFKGIGEVVKDAAIAFTNIVGLLSGDTSIESAEFSWKKFATAIEHVEHGLVAVMKSIAGAEMAIAHVTSSASAFLAGNSAVAAKEGKAAKDNVDLGSGAVLGIGALGTMAGVKSISAFFRNLLGFGGGAAAGAAEGAAAGGVMGTLAAMLARLSTVGMVLGGAWAGTKLGEFGFERFKGSSWFPEWEAWKKEHVPEWLQHGAKSLGGFLYNDEDQGRPSAAAKTASVPAPGSSDIVSAIKESAIRNNVPPAFALAIAKQESNLGKNVGPSSAGALGVMQLMPETAKELGVNPNDQGQNIEGGVRYLGQLLARYHGDMAKAAAAYNAGPGRVDKSSGLGDLPKETRGYVPRVLQFTEGFEKTLAAEPDAASAGAAPAWFSSEPTWFSDSPDWYRQAPEWMKGARPGDAVKMAEQSAGATSALAPAAASQSRDAFTAYQSLSPSQKAPSVTANNTVNVSVGGVFVSNPGADANTIARQLAEKIRDQMATRNLLDIPQIAPAW